MQESYGEGVATHTGPESCVAAREGGCEALTGVRAGRVLSRERRLSGVPTPWRKAEGHTGASPSRRRLGAPRGQRPRARTETPRAGTGRSRGRPPRMVRRAASGSPRTYADDERPWEVGQPRSTREAAEQGRGTGGGGGGGKGAGQREPAPAKHAPDTEPGRRAQCAGAGTAGSKHGTRRCGSRRSCTTSTTSSAAAGLLRAEAGGGAGGGRRDVAALRRGPGGESPGPLRTAEARSVPGEAGSSGRTSPRPTGGSGRSASPRWRTRSSSGPRSRC